MFLNTPPPSMTSAGRHRQKRVFLKADDTQIIKKYSIGLKIEKSVPPKSVLVKYIAPNNIRSSGTVKIILASIYFDDFPMLERYSPVNDVFAFAVKRECRQRESGRYNSPSINLPATSIMAKVRIIDHEYPEISDIISEYRLRQLSIISPNAPSPDENALNAKPNSSKFDKLRIALMSGISAVILRLSVTIKTIKV